MKVKLVSKFLTIILLSLFGLFWMIITPFISKFYYFIMPVEHFISYTKFDFQDYTEWDELQKVLRYRSNKRTYIWDFYFKYFCNNHYDTSIDIIQRWIVLYKTKWIEKIDFTIPINPKIKKWQCNVFIHMEIYIEWIKKEISLIDDFKILWKD